MPRFQDKVVIVTGSSSGIGAATALLFAKEGARITITGRKQDKLKEIHDSIVAAGVSAGRILSVIGDIRNDEVQKALIEKTVANVMQLTRLARPHLIASKGEIVIISSIVGQNFAFPNSPFYAIAKAGLDQLTRALAIDLIEHGVRVNGVSPGIVETSLIENSGATEEISKKFYKFYGSQKASVIAFLADRQVSSYIVGQTIIVDGGSSVIMGLNIFDFETIISS
ncbi:unnamed protein product [Nippostrongylus brasiliensis]|uniref:Dehydrogenase n=1 Tax=Nippostrongylus brasiliensis TaxID=27835 RepID=A0A158QWK5_NIPBR|nr:unnamed protein product [Nippostrongylus brasiliensis]